MYFGCSAVLDDQLLPSGFRTASAACKLMTTASALLSPGGGSSMATRLAPGTLQGSASKSAAFYDAVYAAQDYAGEAERIDALIKVHARTSAKTLPDVGVMCGTRRRRHRKRAAGRRPWLRRSPRLQRYSPRCA
jgi:hypothetical protein